MSVLFCEGCTRKMEGRMIEDNLSRFTLFFVCKLICLAGRTLSLKDSIVFLHSLLSVEVRSIWSARLVAKLLIYYNV